MILASKLREALRSFHVARIESAGIHFRMTAVRAWGPEFSCELVLRKFPRSHDASMDTLEIDCGDAIVRNGYTDEGRRFHDAAAKYGPEQGSFSRWEYSIDSHGSSAIYLPEFASFRLNRDQVLSIYAASRMCDEMLFQLWLDGGTSPVLVENSMHVDVLSVHCSHARGRKMPEWEHTIEERVGPHNTARPGACVNVWPETRRTMDSLQRIGNMRAAG